MTPLRRVLAAVATAAAATTAAALAAAPAGAAEPTASTGTVFVQNDNTNGNVVFAYDRHADGTLSRAGRYPTGGLGGVLAGSVVDHLASQGGLTLDAADHLLFAVNAGSDTVSVFGVSGDRLTLRQTLASEGTFPVSVTAGDGRAYVLNARDGGSVSGYRIGTKGRVFPISGATRTLGLDPTQTPEFTHTPGQVLLSPTGEQLIVPTKGNGSQVDVFPVRPSGRFGRPAVTTLAGAVPFSGAYDSAGHLLLTEAGTNSVVSFAVGSDGSLTQLGSVATGQAATCWVVANGNDAYASNAGSGSLTGVTAAANGTLTSIGQTSTDPGTVDASVTSDGSYLYVQAGAGGSVDEYAIGSGGVLTAVGSVSVPNGAGAEGIAAS